MADAEQLEAQERELLRPEVRSDSARVRELLHPEFVEIGRSGRVWSADEVVGLFADGPPAGRIVADGFGVSAVGHGCMLVTYRSAHVGADGSWSRHAWRSSLWINLERTWKLRFHQGTPTAPFDPW